MIKYLAATLLAATVSSMHPALSLPADSRNVWAVNQRIDLSYVFNYQGRTFQYLVNEDTETRKLSLTIRTVTLDGDSDAAESHTIFSSKVTVVERDQKVQEIRIVNARSHGSSWMQYESEFMKASFDWQTNRIAYTGVGKVMMDNLQPVADLVEKFDPANSNVAKSIEIVVAQFIKQYHPIFSYPQKAEEALVVEGNAELKGATWFYTLERDYFKQGEDNLEVHDATEALAYHTLSRTTADAKATTVMIYGARNKGYEWSFNTGDYLKVVFDLESGKITYTPAGVLTAGQAVASPVQQFTPGEMTNEKAAKIAVEYFIKAYQQTFLKN